MKACWISATDLPVLVGLLGDAAVERGLSIVPGQIALQRMPCLMKSAATALVRPITAALDAP